MAHLHPTRPPTVIPPRATGAARCAVSSAGFSLIEVLISIVVLSFGLLGMVGMQAAALQSNREARAQSSAIVMARELAESIRGNRAEGIKATADNPYVGAFSSPMSATAPAYCFNLATQTGGTACADTAAIASSQMTEWLARVDAELPGARVAICYDATPFDSNGLPRWACDGAGNILVIKIGWTKSATNKSTSGSAAFERATLPSIVVPVTAGS